MKTDTLTLQRTLQHPKFGPFQVSFIDNDYIGLRLANQGEVLIRMCCVSGYPSRTSVQMFLNTYARWKRESYKESDLSKLELILNRKVAKQAWHSI